MKKALVIIGLCLLAGYLIFSLFYFKEKPKDGVCSKFEVEIKNAAAGNKFIEAKEIELFIKEKGLDPAGKHLRDINTNAIEEAILENKLVKSASVFVTNNGAVKVILEERKPVLRVIAADGSYYIDSEGERMPLSRRSTAYLPIATGSIKEDFAKTDLYKFALFLQNDKFWNAQIEQIIVEPNRDIKLIPRVGDHQIILGKLNDGYQERLDKLLAFYKGALNETGWNKYAVINLKFDKQVVCTKR